MEYIDLNNRTLSLSQYVGGLIRQVRLENGLSGRELARLVHMSQQQISRYERGQTGFQLDVLFRLLFALKMNEHEIKNFFNQVMNKNNCSY
ncbi:MAG: helix-turn-helix transcriptional regulator [Providencia heimbachae]|nr:helix-turn-helix transcriptional regulator [Providencia heimbachae]